MIAAQPQAGKPPLLEVSSPSTGAAVSLDVLEPSPLGSVSPSPEVLEELLELEVLVDDGSLVEELGALVLVGAEVVDSLGGGGVVALELGESLVAPPPEVVVSLEPSSPAPVSPPGGA